jgi:hypothetical protein
LREIRQNVDPDYARDDGMVSIDKAATRLALALLCTCGSNSNVALAGFCGCSRTDTGTTEEGGVGEVLDLSLETRSIRVGEKSLRSDTA